MIFVGDIALPFKSAIEICELPIHLKNKNWFGNLEGAIVDSNVEDIRNNIVFNDEYAIRDILNTFKFSGLALANNHIFDTGSYSMTVNFLDKMGVPYGGIGESFLDASNPIHLEENDKSIVVLNFGWEVIQCEVTHSNKVGVNSLEKDHVIKTVNETLAKYSKSRIVVFFHWSYELEAEPQPFERQLAKHLIDLGIDGIIGAHPHRVGGIEFYKGKPIVYSLGNWLFKQNYYRNGKLKFPEFCNIQLAFEWNFESNEYYFHFFNFDPVNSNLSFLKTETIEGELVNSFTPFKDLTDSEYKIWYKKNHYHKREGLPIYYWEDSSRVVKFKNIINLFRDFLIFLKSKIVKYD